MPTAPWFLEYTQWRFLGLPKEFPGSLATYPRPSYPPRITAKYQWVLDEWDRFQIWNAWRDSGSWPPRPSGVWHRVPQWAWGIRSTLVRLRKQHDVVTPAPVPPQAPGDPFGRNWICMGEAPEKAQMYPARFGIAFTADPNYPKPTLHQVAFHVSRGQRVAMWCDCHTTFPDEAAYVGTRLGITTVIGEGESAHAFQVALDAGLRMAWVNLSALTGDQKTAIRNRRIITPNELYLNQDISRASRENWENLPVPGRLIACYDASGEADTGGRLPFSEYVRLGKWSPYHDSFYDPGATDVDRKGVVEYGGG